MSRAKWSIFLFFKYGNNVNKIDSSHNVMTWQTRSWAVARVSWP